MIDKAIGLWNKIIKADSSSSSSIWAMLDLAKTKKTFQEKYSIYKTALHLAKDNKTIVYQSILLLLGYNKDAPDSAETMARRIISGDDGRTREIRQRGLSTIYNILRKKDRNRIPVFAEEVYNESNPYLLLQLGTFIADSLDNTTLGIRHLEKAYEITSAESVYETVAHGRYDIKWLNSVAESFKYGRVALALGEKYYKQKNYDNALKYLLESAPVNERDKYPNAHYLLGYTYKDLRKKEEAVKWLVTGLVLKDDKKAMSALESLVKELEMKKTALQLILEERMKKANPATDFTLSTLKNERVQLSKLYGKVVMLDFWATWCVPCVGELPQLTKLYEKYANNKNVLFYSIDVNEQAKIIEDFMTKKGYSFEVLIAEGTDVQKSYGVEAIPTKFLIDKKGRIQFTHIGVPPNEDVVEQLSKEIDELLQLEK